MNTYTQLKQIAKAFRLKQLEISSPVFSQNRQLPVKYTCDGRNTNPPLDIEGLPEKTKSLAVILEDPGAPCMPWVHWLTWNIPVSNHIREYNIEGIRGLNDYNKSSYDGPCPLGGSHSYFFKVYALDCILHIPVSSCKTDLGNAMNGHIIGYGELAATYQHQEDHRYSLL